MKIKMMAVTCLLLAGMQTPALASSQQVEFVVNVKVEGFTVAKTPRKIKVSCSIRTPGRHRSFKGFVGLGSDTRPYMPNPAHIQQVIVIVHAAKGKQLQKGDTWSCWVKATKSIDAARSTLVLHGRL